MIPEVSASAKGVLKQNALTNVKSSSIGVQRVIEMLADIHGTWVRADIGTVCSSAI